MTAAGFMLLALVAPTLAPVLTALAIGLVALAATDPNARRRRDVYAFAAVVALAAALAWWTRAVLL